MFMMVSKVENAKLRAVPTQQPKLIPSTIEPLGRSFPTFLRQFNRNGGTVAFRRFRQGNAVAEIARFSAQPVGIAEGYGKCLAGKSRKQARVSKMRQLPDESHKPAMVHVKTKQKTAAIAAV